MGLLALAALVALTLPTAALAGDTGKRGADPTVSSPPVRVAASAAAAEAAVSSPLDIVGLGSSTYPDPNAWYNTAGSADFVWSTAWGTTLSDRVPVADGIGWESAVYGDYLYMADDWAGLAVFDIADPASPALLRLWPVANIQAVAVAGTHLFAVGTGGFYVFSLANPTTPTLIAALADPYRMGGAYDLEIDGQFAYAASDKGLTILDISLPGSPHIEAAATPPSWGVWPEQVTVHDSFAYLGCGESGVMVVDVTSPASPVVKPLFRPRTGLYGGLLARGDRLYVGVSGHGVLTLDISQPAALRLLATCKTADWPYNLSLQGTTLYVADSGGGLALLDASDPDLPFLVGSCATGGCTNGVLVVSGYALLAEGDVLNAPYPGADPALSSVAVSPPVNGQYEYTLDSTSGAAPNEGSTLTASAENRATVTIPGDGRWYFHVRALDEAGLAGPWASYRAQIDSVPPTTTVTLSGDQRPDGAYEGAVSIRLEPSDVASGVKSVSWQLDGNAWVDRSFTGSPISVDLSAAGPHVLRYYAVDKAGNKETADGVSPKAVAFTIIDTIPPRGGVIIEDGDVATTSSTVLVSFWSVDDSPPVEVQLSADGVTWPSDDTRWRPANEAQLYHFPSGEGMRTVYARFRDALGNVSDPVSDSIYVDTIKPTVVLSSRPAWPGASGWYTTSPVEVAMLVLEPEGAPAPTVWYRTSPNGGESWNSWQHARGFTVWTELYHDGVNLVQCYAVDAAGNIGDVVIQPFNIDTSPPLLNTDPDHSGDIYTVGTPVEVFVDAVDMSSGVAWSEVRGDVLESPSLDTSTVGDWSWSAHAEDNAGWAADAGPYSFRVVRRTPTENGGATFHGGSVVPIEFSLPDDVGGFIEGATVTVFISPWEDGYGVGYPTNFWLATAAGKKQPATCKYDPKKHLYTFALSTKGMTWCTDWRVRLNVWPTGYDIDAFDWIFDIHLR